MSCGDVLRQTVELRVDVAVGVAGERGEAARAHDDVGERLVPLVDFGRRLLHLVVEDADRGVREERLERIALEDALHRVARDAPVAADLQDEDGAAFRHFLRGLRRARRAGHRQRRRQ